MRLVHNECGGDLEIDRSAKMEIVTNGDRTDIYYPIKCIGCNQPLGLLPNVDMAAHDRTFDSNCRRYFS